MNILEEIIEYKKYEVKANKKNVAVRKLENSQYFSNEPYSLKNSISRKKAGIIAEFKRRSPSKPVINNNADVKNVTTGYARAGASGLSVLTDSKYFGGNSSDLGIARENNKIPVLRKDFIIDPYQLVEAKAMGADVVLLIAAVLSKNELRLLANDARDLGLETLVEIHAEEEIDKIPANTDIVGVNNRNLNDFTVDTETSKNVAGMLKNEFILISESGISNVLAIKNLLNAGFKGFLIGEAFMKHEVPGEACKDFIEQINKELI